MLRLSFLSRDLSCDQKFHCDFLEGILMLRQTFCMKLEIQKITEAVSFLDGMPSSVVEFEKLFKVVFLAAFSV